MRLFCFTNHWQTNSYILSYIFINRVLNPSKTLFRKFLNRLGQLDFGNYICRTILIKSK